MRQRTFGAGVSCLVFAFATAWAPPALTQTTGKATGVKPQAESSAPVVVSEVQIKLFKFALALRPEQERYWGPVETALRDLSKPPEQPLKVQRASLRPGKKDNPDARYRRLSTAAVPLIKTFDENQRRNLEVLSKTFKFEHWLAAH
jgi:hypothetical protein